MTNDEQPWYSDPDRRPAPPSVPDGDSQPSFPPSPPPGAPPPPASPPPGSPPPFQQPGYGPQPYPQQAPAGYQPYGQPHAGFRPIAQTNGKATTSMVLGIVGLASIFFCYGILGIVLGPIAFFMGRSAQKEMEPSPGSWSNSGMAKAGWIMGLIQIIIAIVAIIAVAAFIIWAVNVDDPNF